MLVNHWVSGSQPSLDIHQASHTLPFLEAPEEFAGNCQKYGREKCDWLSDTHADAHANRVLIQDRAPARVEDTDPLREQAPGD